MSSKKDYEEDERIIILNDVEESTISTAIQSLFSLAQKDKKNPIYIIINTFGGLIYDMFALYDAIKYVQSLGIQVNTIGLGKIMSAGVVLLAAGSIRKIGKSATIMWHWGSDSIEGDIFELKNELSEVERQEELCNEILAKETKMSKQEILDLLSSRMDVYITSEKAIQYGIADGYLETSDMRTIKKQTKRGAKKTTKKKTSRK